MDKSLAVQTTAEGQTQPLWQGWRGREGGKGREVGGREGKRREGGGGERDLNADSVLPHNHGTVTCLPVVMAFINYIQAKYFHENSGVLCGLVHVPHASHVCHTSKLKMTSTDSQPHRSKHTERGGRGYLQPSSGSEVGGATYSHPVCAHP